MTRKTKTELIAAVSMLLVAAVMLSSASFAWMTISTSAAIEDLEISMGTSGNMEIAIAKDGKFGEVAEVTADDHNSQYTWGSIVNAYTSTQGINWPTIVSGGAYYTTAYDSTGRTNGVTQQLTLSTGTVNNGVAQVQAQVDDGTGVKVNKTIAAGYAAWIRTNQTIDDVTVAVSGDITVSGGGNREVSLTSDDVSVAVNLYKFPTNAVKGTGFSETGKGITQTTITSGSSFSLDANVPAMVLVSIGIKGDKLIAADFTSGSALTIKGVDVKFTSAKLANYN